MIYLNDYMGQFCSYSDDSIPDYCFKRQKCKKSVELNKNFIDYKFIDSDNLSDIDSPKEIVFNKSFNWNNNDII